MKHPICRIPSLAVLFTLVALAVRTFAADDAAARWKQYEPSFQAFADEDRAKPPKRGGILFDHYNALVRAYCESTPHHTFIDINPALVDANGHPRLDLYKPDKLHFHLESYEVFAAVIKPVLERVWREVSASSLSPAKGR